MENKPKGALSQISKVVDSAIDWIIVIMFASLIVSCVTQVFMRSILNDSPPWTEERQDIRLCTSTLLAQ